MRPARSASAGLICISQIFASELTHAADPPAASAPSSASFGDAGAVDTEQAARVYRQALALYDEGKLEDALSSMRESYRLSRHAELLYNIARLEDTLGSCVDSLAHYREYLEQVPNGRYRGMAEQATPRLVARCGEPENPPEVAATATSSAVIGAPPAPAKLFPAPERAAPERAAPERAAPERGANRWSTARWIGWSAIGAGALAGLGAVYFTTAAVDARDRFRVSLDGRLADQAPVDWSLQDEQHRDQRWAQVLAVTGGALVTGGVLVVLFAPSGSSSSTTVASVDVAATRLTTSLTHRF